MIEIEYKYVLDNISIDEVISKLSSRVGMIKTLTQIYLPSGGRFRKQSSFNGDESTYEFTYKEKLKTPGNLEINCVVFQNTFDLAADIAVSSLKKHRITFGGGGFKWELDFFFDELGTYFVMMECEVKSEDIIPDITKTGLPMEWFMYNVPLDDGRFTSKKLSSRQYAENVYKGIRSNEYSK